METKSTIKITTEVHKKLVMLKARLGVKTLSDAIDWLIKEK